MNLYLNFWQGQFGQKMVVVLHLNCRPVSPKCLAHHVYRFVQPEYEQTTWAAMKGEKAPNRIYAVAWGVVELLPDVAKRKTTLILLR